MSNSPRGLCDANGKVNHHDLSSHHHHQPVLILSAAIMSLPASNAVSSGHHVGTVAKNPGSGSGSNPRGYGTHSLNGNKRITAFIQSQNKLQVRVYRNLSAMLLFLPWKSNVLRAAIPLGDALMHHLKDTEEFRLLLVRSDLYTPHTRIQT